MKRVKKQIALALAFVLAVSLTACGQTPADPTPSTGPTPEAGAPMSEAIYTAGSYTAQSEGMDGPVTVEVTVSDSAITDLVIDVSGETAGLGTEVGGPLKEAILAAQSAEVDGVSGATISSDAVKSAVQKCLDQAMGKEAVAASGYTAGTYTSTVKGREGEITVNVTFDDASIKEVAVDAQNETYGVGWGLLTTPAEVLPGQIVAAQSLAVDSISSATVTSKAIVAAVADCVTQAGGDAEALKSVPVEKPAAKDETYDADVVVVGAGAAGLAAANAAIEAGANVLLLEKTGVTGGSAARSGGKLLAAGTTWQEKQGQVDSPELMFSYLKSMTGSELINDDLLWPFCENSVENLQWLEDRGVEVIDVEPIHSSLGPMRVHNTKGGGGMTDGIGGQITVPLTQRYEEKGGRIVYNVAANTLLTDADGGVVGVTGVRPDGSTVTIHAPAVIICTGGYAQNRELMTELYGDSLGDSYASGAPTSKVGEGLFMATDIGAKRFISEVASPVYVDYTAGVGINEEAGLIVNGRGERVVNEWTYQFHVGRAIADSGTSYGWYIATANDPNPTVQYAMTVDKNLHAGSVEELAGLMEVDPAVLQATVDRYNELCAKGADDDFGKPADYMIPVEGETYYALKLQPSNSNAFDGLCIDAGAHVLDTDDQPIPGLYAAGEVANTGLFGKEYPCCGMAIGSAVYYGRIAAANAVAGE